MLTKVELRPQAENPASQCCNRRCNRSGACHNYDAPYCTQKIYDLRRKLLSLMDQRKESIAGSSDSSATTDTPWFAQP